MEGLVGPTCPEIEIHGGPRQWGSQPSVPRSWDTWLMMCSFVGSFMVVVGGCTGPMTGTNYI